MIFLGISSNLFVFNIRWAIVICLLVYITDISVNLYPFFSFKEAVDKVGELFFSSGRSSCIQIYRRNVLESKFGHLTYNLILYSKSHMLTLRPFQTHSVQERL